MRDERETAARGVPRRSRLRAALEELGRLNPRAMAVYLELVQRELQQHKIDQLAKAHGLK